MTTKPVSLNAQLEEVRYVLDYAYTSLSKGMRGSEMDLHRQRMCGVEKTLMWFLSNEDGVRAYIEERRNKSITDAIRVA